MGRMPHAYAVSRLRSIVSSAYLQFGRSGSNDQLLTPDVKDLDIKKSKWIVLNSGSLYQYKMAYKLDAIQAGCRVFIRLLLLLCQ